MNGSGGNGQPGSSFYSYSIRGNPKLSTATTSSGPRGQTRPTDTVRAACHGSAGDPVLTAAGEGSPGPLLGRGGRRWGLGLAAEKPAQKHNPQGPQAAGTSQLRGLPPGVGAWEGRRLAVAVEKSGTGALDPASRSPGSFLPQAAPATDVTSQGGSSPPASWHTHRRTAWLLAPPAGPAQGDPRLLSARR